MFTKKVSKKYVEVWSAWNIVFNVLKSISLFCVFFFQIETTLIVWNAQHKNDFFPATFFLSRLFELGKKFLPKIGKQNLVHFAKKGGKLIDGKVNNQILCLSIIT